MKDGSLVLVTRITIIRGTNDDPTCKEKEQLGKIENYRRIFYDFTNMVCGELKDFEIVCEEKVIKCHKRVIMAR